MKQFKTIVTLTWKFESDENPAKCLEFAKRQLDEILETKPVGADFDGFSVQVDLAQMKERKKLIHLGTFPLDEVFPYITEQESKRDYTIGSKVFQVRMNSDRYHVFKANNKCVSCGLEGTKMILDMNPGDNSPHFNLYGEEDGRLILMTKDHILAKSRGGGDVINNYQSMCATCNNLKGAYDLTLEHCRELRRLYDNAEKLPRKELRELINKTREKLAQNKSKEEYVCSGNSQQDLGCKAIIAAGNPSHEGCSASEHGLCATETGT